MTFYNKQTITVSLFYSQYFGKIFRDFLASFYNTTITWFDCERATTWLGNNCQVQFKSSTSLNSCITYLNFLTCSFWPFLSVCEFVLFQFFPHAVPGQQELAGCLAGVLSFCTAFRASCFKLPGLGGSLATVVVVEVVLKVPKKCAIIEIKISRQKSNSCYWKQSLL